MRREGEGEGGGGRVEKIPSELLDFAFKRPSCGESRLDRIAAVSLEEGGTWSA